MLSILSLGLGLTATETCTPTLSSKLAILTSFLKTDEEFNPNTANKKTKVVTPVNSEDFTYSASYSIDPSQIKDIDQYANIAIGVKTGKILKGEVDTIGNVYTVMLKTKIPATIPPLDVRGMMTTMDNETGFILTIPVEVFKQLKTIYIARVGPVTYLKQTFVEGPEPKLIVDYKAPCLTGSGISITTSASTTQPEDNTFITSVEGLKIKELKKLFDCSRITPIDSEMIERLVYMQQDAVFTACLDEVCLEDEVCDYKCETETEFVGCFTGYATKTSALAYQTTKGEFESCVTQVSESACPRNYFNALVMFNFINSKIENCKLLININNSLLNVYGMSTTNYLSVEHFEEAFGIKVCELLGEEGEEEAASTASSTTEDEKKSKKKSKKSAEPGFMSKHKGIFIGTGVVVAVAVVAGVGYALV